MVVLFRIYPKAFDFPFYSSMSFVKLSKIYSPNMDWITVIIAKLKNLSNFEIWKELNRHEKVLMQRSGSSC